MSYMKGVRCGSEGNANLLKQYTGGSSTGTSRNTGGKCYANGGTVKGGNPSLAEGLSAAGTPAKPSLARPGRKMKGAKKGDKGKTNINVVVMGQKPDAPAMPAGPIPPPEMMGGPAGPGGPPMPPGMPMRKHGGRVKRADGGPTPGEQMAEARKRRDEASAERSKQGGNAAMNTGVAAGLMGVPGKVAKVLKIGNAALAGSSLLGAASAHGKKKAAEDEMRRLGEGKVVEGEEDRKSGGRVKRAPGGPVMGLKNSQGGSGGAKGRLAKVRMYGK